MKKVLLPAFTLARTPIAYLALFLHLNGLSSVFAQVRIGDKVVSATDPIPAMNPNSLLELESASRGLLLPRLTTAQINAMQNVPAGMLVYNTTDNLLNIRIKSSWVPLVKADNSEAANNPWAMKGTTTYVMNGNVGIGTSNAGSQLANTFVSPVDANQLGSGYKAITWLMNERDGYVGALGNESVEGNANGVLVKVNSLSATALNVSRGPKGSVVPLLIVKSNGKVGIGMDTPSEALDISGNIKYSGNIQMGLQFISEEYSVIGHSNASRTVGCPVATRLIGGGGGQLDPTFQLANTSVTYNGPDAADMNAWRVSCSNQNESVVQVRVYAICAKVQ